MNTLTTFRWNTLHNKLFFAVIAVWLISFSSSAGTGGISTVVYYSTTQSDTCRMNVYVPPGYDDGSDTNHYPVFYLVHGFGEDYTYWDNYGLVDTVLNYYIPAGIAVPMIIVMPDGRNLPPDTYSSEIRNDVIPYIESNYRVIADKDHRGVGGLSWGGQQSLELGILHYEMFGYMAILSSGYFSSDNYDEAKAMLDTSAAEVEKSLRYFYFAEGTSFDLAYASGMEALKLFRDHGLTVHYWEFQGGHQWSVWKEDFKAFTPFIFRDTSTRYISLAFQGGKILNSTIMTYRDSLAPAPEDPTRTGYSFAGWYREPEYIDSFNFSMDTIKSNLTLYAKWSINSYKVSFNSNGGNYTPDTITAVYNTKIEEPAEPIKSGFFFGGWYTDTAFTQKWDFAYNVVTSDITLNAKWSDVSSINVNKESDIIVFPNPAQTYVQVSNLPSVACIEIFSVEGKLLLRTEKVHSNDFIDIGNLPQGIYSLYMRCVNANYHFKFIKK
jgi:uncharacterized repeat protein (TIGR02543 family)